MTRLTVAALVLLLVAIVSFVVLVEYVTHGPLFTRYEDGSYCAYEGTPWQQCDCAPGWPCDDDGRQWYPLIDTEQA